MPEPTGTGAEERRWTLWPCDCGFTGRHDAFVQHEGVECPDCHRWVLPVHAIEAEADSAVANEQQSVEGQ
jgi:hypothetical protein